MDNNCIKKPFILELMQNFATIFTMSVIAISFAGLLVIRYAPDVQKITTLFNSDNTFKVILQIAVSSLFLAFFCILIITERFILKMHFCLRLLLLFFSALITFSIFAIIFKWFPVNCPQTWFGFIICTIICYIISLGLTLLKFQIEGKKYKKLLTNYKERKKTT